MSEAAQALLGGSAVSTTSIPGSACCLGRQAELCGFPDFCYRALNQGKCEQARAEKRDTDNGKGQEATRNKVVIAHGAVLDCAKEANTAAAAFPPDQHFCSNPMQNSFLSRLRMRVFVVIRASLLLCGSTTSIMHYRPMRTEGVRASRAAGSQLSIRGPCESIGARRFIVATWLSD